MTSSSGGKGQTTCETRYVNPVISAKCELNEGHEGPHVDWRGVLGLAWTKVAAWKVVR